MELEFFDIEGPILIKPKLFNDNRGYFCEKYVHGRVEPISLNWVQENQSFSTKKHTLRGLHFQKPPMAQDKLVSVVNGSIKDVIVDLRTSSVTFGKYIKIEINSDNLYQLYVPKGFAHGFLTLEDNTIVQYKVTNYYSNLHDDGIKYNDEILSIDWGCSLDDIIISKKDSELPKFDFNEEYFK